MQLDEQKRYNILMELLLFVVALLLLITYGVVRFFYGYLKYIFKGDWKKLAQYQRKINIGLDEAGNTIGGPYLNDFFKRKDGYEFGRSDETISSALGKNERDKTLRPMGKILTKILNKLDYNHSIKSIEDFSHEKQ